MSKRSRERILIWGKTRPELSFTYGELVCTGGMLERTGQLIRLYPVPLRYLNDELIFKKYQWIEADIEKSSRDPRPESYHIEFNGITVGEHVGTDDASWDSRAALILRPENIVPSVEELQAQQQQSRRSLGIMKPKTIHGVSHETVSVKEKEEWLRRYEENTAQGDLQFIQEEKRNLKPIPPPDFRFRITFDCDDPRCPREHTFSILDWEVDALYKAMRDKGLDATMSALKVIERLNVICSEANDTRFFLGNISTHPNVFTVVGLWYPKREMLLENRMPLFGVA